MATSGTITFRLTRDQIITSALLKVGALDVENATPTANQITYAAQNLNMMVKGWEAEGLQLWERKYGVIFPQKGQEWYALGSPGPAGDHACLSTPLGSGFIQTTLNGAVAALGTSVTLTATDNSSTIYTTVGVPALTVTAADKIGIQQTDGTMYWTTVNTVNTTTKVVTLVGTGLTIGAATGAYVVVYTTKLMRPLRILAGLTRQTSGGNDIPTLLIPRENYALFGTKSSKGTSIQLYYDPQENTGHLYVYPTTSDVTTQIFIEFQKPIEDFSATGDDFDLPQEWCEAIVWGLALRIAPDYEVPQEKFVQIKMLADQFFTRLNGWDQENTSLYLQPSQWAYMDMQGGNK